MEIEMMSGSGHPISSSESGCCAGHLVEREEDGVMIGAEEKKKVPAGYYARAMAVAGRKHDYVKGPGGRPGGPRRLSISVIAVIERGCLPGSRLEDAMQSLAKCITPPRRTTSWSMPKLTMQRRAKSRGWKKTDMVLLGKLSTLLHLKKMDELEEADRKKGMARDLEDAEDEFRISWNARWSGRHGSFEDITIINPMRFTYDPPTPSAKLCDTLQFFSIKVVSIRHDLQWPLNVFGMVAVRDSIDQNRNLLFYRTRDNCQALTVKDQYLVLSGPSRAVVLTTTVPYPVTIEVELKVKGINESDDKDLFLLAEPLGHRSYVSYEPLGFYNEGSKIEFALGDVGSSVEATIFIRVIDGSWPDGFHGQFSAHTSRTDNGKIILLDFGDDNLPVNGDGIMNLSRHVVSVENNGKLKVSFEAWGRSVAEGESEPPWQDDSTVVAREMVFKTAKAGKSYGTLHFGPCKMEVLVAWSLTSPDPEPDF